MTFPGRAMLLALVAGAPALVVAVGFVARASWWPVAKWTLALALTGWWLGIAWVLRHGSERRLRTLSNLLAGLREGDLSVRARVGEGSPRDPLTEALRAANQLADTLDEHRLGAVDATTLLRKVMEQIDVAVIAIDDRDRLALANRGAEHLLGRPVEALRGQSVEQLGLTSLLEGAAPRLLAGELGAAHGRWELRRADFRQRGRPYRLIVLTDLSRALHHEEQQAWKRLIRVISHEINNSLAPIHSIASGLSTRLPALDTQVALQPDLQRDLQGGLQLIAQRSDALSRFMAAHARLARLPPPVAKEVDVRAWVGRVVRLETRHVVEIEAGPAVTIDADEDQLDQLLINLVANAVDAVAETQGCVEVGWRLEGPSLQVWVRDEGTGLDADPTNLFVPFYSTKAEGSGIGLALSREIAVAHGGSLTLANRTDGVPGCEAQLRLPVGTPSAGSVVSRGGSPARPG